MSILIPFLKVLYKDFPKKSNEVGFGEWFAIKQKAQADFASVHFQESSEEVSLEQISSQDLSHLDSQVKLVFMRNHGKSPSASSSFFGRGQFGFFPKNVLLRLVFILVLIACCLFAIYGYLKITNSTCTFTFKNNKSSHSITLPFNQTNENYRKDIIQKGQTAVPDKPSVSFDTTAPAIHAVTKTDTVKKTISFKKLPKPPTVNDSTEHKEMQSGQFQPTKHSHSSDTFSSNPYSAKAIITDPLQPQISKPKSSSSDKTSNYLSTPSKKINSTDTSLLGQ